MQKHNGVQWLHMRSKIFFDCWLIHSQNFFFTRFRKTSPLMPKCSTCPPPPRSGFLKAAGRRCYGCLPLLPPSPPQTGETWSKSQKVKERLDWGRGQVFVHILHIQGARGIAARFLKWSPASTVSPIMTKFSQYTPHSTCYLVMVSICRQD